MQSMSPMVSLNQTLTTSREWPQLLSLSHLSSPQHSQINNSSRLNTTCHRSFSLGEEITMLWWGVYWSRGPGGCSIYHLMGSRSLKMTWLMRSALYGHSGKGKRLLIIWRMGLTKIRQNLRLLGMGLDWEYTTRWSKISSLQIRRVCLSTWESIIGKLAKILSMSSLLPFWLSLAMWPGLNSAALKITLQR